MVAFSCVPQDCFLRVSRYANGTSVAEEDVENRRRDRRHAAEFRIELRHLGRPGESFADVTHNVSEGGLFIESSMGLELGTEVQLEILPTKGAQPITLVARVVRVEEEAGEKHSKKIRRVRGMALEFVDRDHEEVKRLMELTKRVGEYLSAGS